MRPGTHSAGRGVGDVGGGASHAGAASCSSGASSGEPARWISARTSPTCTTSPGLWCSTWITPTGQGRREGDGAVLAGQDGGRKKAYTHWHRGHPPKWPIPCEDGLGWRTGCTQLGPPGPTPSPASHLVQSLQHSATINCCGSLTCVWAGDLHAGLVALHLTDPPKLLQTVGQGGKGQGQVSGEAAAPITRPERDPKARPSTALTGETSQHHCRTQPTSTLSPSLTNHWMSSHSLMPSPALKGARCQSALLNTPQQAPGSTRVPPPHRSRLLPHTRTVHRREQRGQASAQSASFTCLRQPELLQPAGSKRWCGCGKAGGKWG